MLRRLVMLFLSLMGELAVHEVVAGGVTGYSVKTLPYIRGIHNYSQKLLPKPSAITALETRNGFAHNVTTVIKRRVSYSDSEEIEEMPARLLRVYRDGIC